MPLDIKPIPVLSDNYAWLLTTPQGARAVVDPGEPRPVMDEIGEGRLDMILLTHHHADHTAGTEALRERYGAQVCGPRQKQEWLPRLDHAVEGGDVVSLGSTQIRVLSTPGHAVGHVSYVVDEVPALFCGDVLFSLGCGRLLEGTAQELFDSLNGYDSLPDSTLVCAGHEYTRSNLAFALHVDPDNAALKARAGEVERLLEAGRPTLPVALGVERRTNPFLLAPDVETFARLRREKDTF
ncbi:hydroxyacylglutathione hydrolase [Gluconobacter albidus]|uniref:Hydroxyacylglutathione hydrolase n=1 Tax=Gluconobacter albidus TaxID=318683 RepID=A0AAW3QT17_9PROT|nr:hydroxyacylglutathione hydrolase [Gluconobacter albidus]KXV36768.1 hydroxyacylglutathione hydrolase [Gluconobacter albidus]MBS1026607.1 hydroxyacylglutathione hydrolase [Gluconobacter albidus]MCP1272112.1 hydroxyacylglutathione hydrolase [Gluconobacter albidus]GBQ83279.1 hydroxyacylglutathione hydrolase [Gluconobacter albidus NBRC 3250]GLQ70583.1 hydroxyacylglutathione hydrolase [Gluconobacter albidus]